VIPSYFYSEEVTIPVLIMPRVHVTTGMDPGDISIDVYVWRGRGACVQVVYHPDRPTHSKGYGFVTLEVRPLNYIQGQGVAIHD
jgi:hypothetical protein